MGGKKADTRFTLKFNKDNPLHAQAVEVLNQQGFHGKSQYIANAIKHYETWIKIRDNQLLTKFDENAIESVVSRFLNVRAVNSAGTSIGSVPEDLLSEQPQFVEEINFVETMTALGEDGINAIADAMEMFRSI